VLCVSNVHLFPDGWSLETQKILRTCILDEKNLDKMRKCSERDNKVYWRWWEGIINSMSGPWPGWIEKALFFNSKSIYKSQGQMVEIAAWSLQDGLRWLTSLIAMILSYRMRHSVYTPMLTLRYFNYMYEVWFYVRGSQGGISSRLPVLQLWRIYNWKGLCNC
jgi:hypothetical protein